VFKKLFCSHHWVDQIPFLSIGDNRDWIKVGLKDWRDNSAYFGCVKCGKVKRFRFDHIPINYEES
jgi:hypothetical protein